MVIQAEGKGRTLKYLYILKTQKYNLDSIDDYEVELP